MKFVHQIFKCFHCNNEVVAKTFEECDWLEGNRCDQCDDGVYNWIAPADEASLIPHEASGVIDDQELEDEVDTAFDRLLGD